MSNKDLRKENKTLGKKVQWLTAEIEDQDDRIENLEAEFRGLAQAFAELEGN